jgi:hypothetical protein
VDGAAGQETIRREDVERPTCYLSSSRPYSSPQLGEATELGVESAWASSSVNCNLVNTAIVSFEVLKTGQVDVAGRHLGRAESQPQGIT